MISYKVVAIGDAKEFAYPGSDDIGEYHEDHEMCLYRFEDDVPTELIYVDQGDCPEDMYLFRDLRKFVDELNRICKELG